MTHRLQDFVEFQDPTLEVVKLESVDLLSAGVVISRIVDV